MIHPPPTPALKGGGFLFCGASPHTPNRWGFPFAPLPKSWVFPFAPHPKSGAFRSPHTPNHGSFRSPHTPNQGGFPFAPHPKSGAFRSPHSLNRWGFPFAPRTPFGCGAENRWGVGQSPTLEKPPSLEGRGLGVGCSSVKNPAKLNRPIRIN